MTFRPGELVLVNPPRSDVMTQLFALTRSCCGSNLRATGMKQMNKFIRVSQS